jgi:acyl dehydratase
MVELSSVPSLTVLYPKAVLTGFRRKGGELPNTVYTLPGMRIDRAHLAAYNRICGFRLTDELPVTYPHVLAFPLQIKLMAGSDFPFPLVGSVHVANRITQTRPLRVTEEPDLRVHLENLRAHPRGQQFDMISEALVDGEVVWTDVSTYLRRSGGSGNTERREETETPTPTSFWRVPNDMGRRYGDICGDRNPIHLYKLTARMFGFPRAIAHGMWTKARCLAAFEGRLPNAYTVNVTFKLPVLLPAKVAFTAREKNDGWRFDVFNAKNNKPHLTGEITP